MSLRTGLLGLAGVLAVAGLAAAEPPVNPLVEGRELDPVAREFNMPEQPLGGYVAPVTPERTDPSVWIELMADVWDLLLDQFTFPLGAAVTPDEVAWM